MLFRSVSEGGSGTRLRYLVNALEVVHKARIRVNEEILQLSENNAADVAWVEDVNFTVDDCCSEV